MGYHTFTYDYQTLTYDYQIITYDYQTLPDGFSTGCLQCCHSSHLCLRSLCNFTLWVRVRVYTRPLITLGLQILWNHNCYCYSPTNPNYIVTAQPVQYFASLLANGTNKLISIGVTAKMEDDQNGRRPKWKRIKMEEDQNGRGPKWKTTKMEDDQYGRRPKWKTTKMEDDQIRRRPKWKTTKMEDDQNGRRPKWKTNKIGVN